MVKGERVGGQVHLSVSDDGEGVPYEIQSRIFDKFVQVKRDGGAGGSGLGLAICKGSGAGPPGDYLARLGAGSGQHLYFHPPGGRLNRKGVLTMTAKPILIVDDEKNIRLALSMSLETAEYPGGDGGQMAKRPWRGWRRVSMS